MNETSLPPLPDQHTHTRLCLHAEGMPADYLQAACRRGLPGIAATDHHPAPDGYDPLNRMPQSDWPRYEQAVREAAEDGAGLAAFGIEADFYPGAADYLPAWLAARPFDLVLGSIHYIDGWDFDHPDEIPRWRHEDPARIWTRYGEILQDLVSTGWYDVIAHADLPKKFGFRPPARLIREIFLPVLDAAAEQGLALEINTAGLRVPAGECYPSSEILAWARERDIPITFGSDAHRPDQVGSGFDQALACARDCGYETFAAYRSRRAELCPLPA